MKDKYTVRKILTNLSNGNADFKFQIKEAEKVICDDITNEKLAIELCKEMNRVCQIK